MTIGAMPKRVGLALELTDGSAKLAAAASGGADGRVAAGVEEGWVTAAAGSRAPTHERRSPSPTRA